MTTVYWILFLLATVGVYFLYEWISPSRPRNATPPRADAEPPAGRRGHAPYPAAMITDMPSGMRLIDLRRLPARELELGRVDVVREQLALMRLLLVQIWVVDAATARGWLALSDVALVIVVGHLKDRRAPEAKNLIYVAGERLTEAEGQRFAALGLELVLSLSDPLNPALTIDHYLPAHERWAPSPDDRPVPPADVIKTDPLVDDLVRAIEGFVFVDFRRASPAALRNGVAFTRVETSLAPAAALSPSYVVWVLAPWVLDELAPDAVPRVRAMLERIEPRVGHRLAVVIAAGESIPTHPLVAALSAAGATRLAEEYSFLTADRGRFRVPPIEALEDSYYLQAWKTPRL